jgi:hypothetical protein
MLEILLDVLKTNKMDYTFWFVNWGSFIFSIILLLVVVFNIERLGSLSDGLTKLAIFLTIISLVICFYTMASKKRIGATCEDGWQSYSIGSGTCSHHGGIETWRYKYWFDE